jgi:hypothetical protein
VYAALMEEALPAEETAIVRGRLFNHARQRAEFLRRNWGGPGLGCFSDPAALPAEDKGH